MIIAERDLAKYTDRMGGGVVRITVFLIEREPKLHLGAKLADYETASRGAKASLRKSVAEIISTQGAI